MTETPIDGALVAAVATALYNTVRRTGDPEYWMLSSAQRAAVECSARAAIRAHNEHTK